MRTRADIALSAAAALQTAPPAGPALVGFDGFVDSIVRLVASRSGMGPSDFTPIRTISEFASRCAQAAGRSTNIERVLLEDRFGGNGPLLAGGLASLGVPVTYIGAVGDAAVEPIFRPFAARCRCIIPLASSSHTLCLEFDDGKIMINDTANVQRVTWERLVSIIPTTELASIVQRCTLLGVVNWSLVGGVPGLLEGLRTHVLPGLTGERRLFVDISDPAKRTDADIASMLGLLSSLNASPGLSVTLGLNLSEAERLSRVLSLPATPPGSTADAALSLASVLRAACRLDTVVVHPREGAAASSASGHAHWFDGPLTRSPRLSTGAGDHFNAGFAFAQVRGLPLDECLAVGCAVSGAYVRDAASPDASRLVSFLQNLPDPQPAA
ncbi:MAG: hypothetical protein IT433_00200 [Phycisphaerales bacterium]|nr:hypothetical protein [Phycisphaerales bacterium]